MKKLLNIPVLDYVALNQELPHSGKLRLHTGGGQGTAPPPAKVQESFGCVF
jgi:hypothetical protein